MWSILGSGVTGLCVATALSERGAEVEVIVPDDAPAAASGLAGGMLAPFCESETAPDAIVTLGQHAVDWWATRVTSVERRGTLVLATVRDTGELHRFARATREHAWVEPAALEPELEGRFAQGLFFASEAHMNPNEALATLRQSLVARGVAFRFAAPLGRIIDCRGFSAADNLLDLRAVRGEMLLVHAPEVTLTRPVRLLHPRFACYIVPRGNGHYMIGATMVESAQTGPVTARAMMELLSAAYAIHPAFAEAHITATGAGLRPAFTDNMPAIRHVGDRIHVNGMYRHGFLMAPVLAEQLARDLTKEWSDAD